MERFLQGELLERALDLPEKLQWQLIENLDPAISHFEFLAPVLSTSISSWIMAFALYHKSKKLGFYFDWNLIKKITMILVSTIILSLVLILAQKEWFYLLTTNNFSLFYLIILISASSSIYFLTLWFFGILNKNK